MKIFLFKWLIGFAYLLDGITIVGSLGLCPVWASAFAEMQFLEECARQGIPESKWIADLQKRMEELNG